ncbi:MAG: diguanylate cyclase [Clostridiaceae bacterium]
MNESAVKIEKIMELIMSLNEDMAKQKKYVEVLEEKNTILNTLTDVNFYMGNSLEIKDMIKNIIDVVLGVLGVTACSISITNGSNSEITEQCIIKDMKIVTPDNTLQIENLIEKNGGEIFVNDLSKNNICNLNRGSFIAVEIHRNITKYGFISLYYDHPDIISEAKLEFFRLLAAQLGVNIENAFLYEKVSIASKTDNLTRLYNRTHLNKIISEGCLENAENIGVVMADIDNFKKVNDTYGHLFGDKVLKFTGDLFNAVAEKYKGTAFRYGGEEIILIFKDTDKANLVNAAEEIRDKFSKKIFLVNDLKVNFTLSLGVSKMIDSSRIIDMFKLINLADDALYVAKKNGKNRYVFLDGNLELYLKSKKDLNQLAGKYKRTKEAFMLVKISVPVDKIYEISEYNKIIEMATKCFRQYDNVFYNSVGEILVILENIIDDELLKNKVSTIKSCKIDKLIYDDDSVNIKKFLKIKRDIE